MNDANFSELCTPLTCSCNAAGRTGSHRCRMVFFRGKFRRVESSDSDSDGESEPPPLIGDPATVRSPAAPLLPPCLPPCLPPSHPLRNEALRWQVVVAGGGPGDGVPGRGHADHAGRDGGVLVAGPGRHARSLARHGRRPPRLPGPQL